MPVEGPSKAVRLALEAQPTSGWKERDVDKTTRNPDETTAIRQRMGEVRCDLDEDVQDIVEGARDIGEWRSYVKAYPWVCLGAALAVGYFIVPRRRLGGQPDTQTPAELPKQSREFATPHSSSQGSLRGLLLPLVANLVMRGVSSYVEQQAGKLFATQSNPSQQDVQP